MLALLGERRSPAIVRQESGVATATDARLGREPTIAVMKQISDRFTGLVVEYNRAFGDKDLEVLTAGTVAVLAAPVSTAGALAMRVISKREQGCNVSVGHKPDRPTITAVAAVRATHCDVSLTPERDRPGATVTGLNIDIALVDKGGHPERLRPP
jgi:hypothetical protein